MKLDEVRKIAMSLPEATEEPHFNRTSFRVGGKIFATAHPDEPFLNVIAGESVREPALAMYADCVEKLLWGKKVLGLRVDLRGVDYAILKDLLQQDWAAKAPKSLRAAAMKSSG